MDIEQTIETVIRDLERERKVRVLFACESGSRAWGFASPNSDYDLRFVYAHPKSWYLELQEKRDVIDLMLPNDLDLAGWDLAKTLRLFASCNLALNEWLDSPIVYWKQADFREELSKLIPQFFNPRKAIHHYLSMARGTAKDHFDGPRIGIKKLFYILRPLLACYWIERHSSMPPTLFQEMLDQQLIDEGVLAAIAAVQARKEVALEGEVIEVPEAIRLWIDHSITHFERTENDYAGSGKVVWDELNSIMYKWAE